jgi:hypothetical protein
MLYQSTCVGLGYGLMEGYFQEPSQQPANPIRLNYFTIRHILLAQEY